MRQGKCPKTNLDPGISLPPLFYFFFIFFYFPISRLMIIYIYNLVKFSVNTSFFVEIVLFKIGFFNVRNGTLTETIFAYFLNVLDGFVENKTRGFSDVKHSQYHHSEVKGMQFVSVPFLFRISNVQHCLKFLNLSNMGTSECISNAVGV